MLRTQYLSRQETKHAVMLWLKFAERESREIALAESLEHGEYDKHLAEAFSGFADTELGYLSRTNQQYAEGLLEGLLIRNVFYQGIRKDERFFY